MQGGVDLIHRPQNLLFLLKTIYVDVKGVLLLLLRWSVYWLELTVTELILLRDLSAAMAIWKGTTL